MAAPTSRIVLALAVCVATVVVAQKPFREYPAMEGGDSSSSLPPDHKAPADFVLGRLMYPSAGRGRGGRGGGFGGGNWTQGGTNWTVDYPRGDRFFASAIRRLTRIDVRSVEQPVNPDDGDDIYHWPYLHVGMPSTWNLTEPQAARIRDYLLRGGFLLCDSFFGTQEWQGFETGLKMIFPNREVEDIPDNDPIFHLLFDLKDRHQVGNFRSLLRDGNPYRADGSVAYWRGVRDDRGRLVVVMAFNSDLGDSWQLADDPRYPEKFSALGLRIGLNFVTYALSH